MQTVTLETGVEKKHAPLARIAAGAVENLPSAANLLLADAAAPASPARRRDDLLVTLERTETPYLERRGARQIAVGYADPHSAAACAAIVAGAALPGTPVCADAGSLALLTLAERVASSDIPVLIAGPTGTGKEVLARFIHARSTRSHAPFVAINCAAMPETMLEAMLFGHVKGAYTGAANAGEGFFRAADGGTLLLDEIAEMPIGLQAKLLRVLQEGEVVPIGATSPIAVNVRIVACANRDLPLEVAEGRLRADLFYRLNVFPIELAALAERIDDIAPLAFAMLYRHGPRNGPLPWITDGAIERLRGHGWPGNVRELENVIRRAMVLAGDAAAIAVEHIVFDTAVRLVPAAAPALPAPPAELAAPPADAPLSCIARHSQTNAIIAVLRDCNGRRGETARRLGISERTLRYRLADMRDAGDMPAMRMPAAAGAAW